MAEHRFTVVHTDAGPDDDLSTETAMFEQIGARLVRAGSQHPGPSLPLEVPRQPATLSGPGNAVSLACAREGQPATLSGPGNAVSLARAREGHVPEGTGTTGAIEDDLIDAVRDADALIVVRSQITARVAEAMHRCQVVTRTGVGYDTLDVPALTQSGILAVNMPDIWTDEVANQALALLLALNRHLPEYDRLVREGRWRNFSQPHIGPLTGETVGIVGYGRIGSAFARRCTALGMRVVAYDPYKSAPLDEQTRAELVPALDALLAQSDYISLHCPLNDETHHLIGTAEFGKMRPGAIVINTARGAVIDEQALIEALHEDRIAGAGIDAFEQEPPAKDSPLLKLNNVVLSPHNAFFSDASVARMHRRVAEEIITVLNGGWPDNPLNPELAAHPKHAHRKAHLPV